MADDVKCRLRCIAHANNVTELTTAIENLRAWDFYEGKLKTWIEGKV